MKTLSFLLFLVSSLSWSQELPPLHNYEPSEYSAGNQNWMVSESDDHFIYIANNKGLLEYNGAQWRLYKTPNESIMRSVKVAGDRIYTGCYMDFGYWQKDVSGTLNYTSLVKTLGVTVEEDEQFWNIIVNEEYILFQSLSHIYSYRIRDGKVTILVSDSIINKFFKVGDNYYYHVLEKGLFTISNQKSESVSETIFFKQNTIVFMFEKDAEFYFITDEARVYRLENNKEVFVSKVDLKEDITVYSALMLTDGSLLLGTISNGVVSMNLDGTTNFKFSQGDGLINNTCLYVFEDLNNNVWLGLDNGISSINIDSPYSIYNDKEGELGTVYDSFFYNNVLYLGTNQGLFYRKENESSFTFMEGTQGQTWTITEFNGDLFCNHNSGIFLIKNNKATRIKGTKGTWDIHAIETRLNVLIAGTYNGLYVLNKESGEWQIGNKLNGFDISSKDVEVVNSQEIYVNHEYKGVFKLAIEPDLSKVIKVERLDYLGKGIGSDIESYRGKLVFAKQDSLFIKEADQEKFLLNSKLSQLIKHNNYTSGTLIKSNDYLWLFNSAYISKIGIEDLDGSYFVEKIFLSKDVRNEKIGYENLTALNPTTYIIGSSYGYTIFNESRIQKTTNEVFINQVRSIDNSNVISYDLDSTPEIPYNENTLTINYSVPAFKSLHTIEYQYKLSNESGEWSKWTQYTSVDFKNLSYGDYSFEVRARVNETVSSNVDSFKFSIAKPYYITNAAIAVYSVLLILLIIALNGFYIWYFKKQKQEALQKQQKELELKNLTNEKNLVQLRNAKLRSDIEHRNKELAISTMAMIKKNETLNELKEQLENLPKSAESSSLKKMLDKNLNSKQDWLTFEEAFNNADKDFFKKIKEAHPSLTSGDLRLCVYLRLNLSSKEIAPLLNISPRSVEIKRYRLRKKLGLSREDSLTSYIVEI